MAAFAMAIKFQLDTDICSIKICKKRVDNNRSSVRVTVLACHTLLYGAVV